MRSLMLLAMLIPLLLLVGCAKKPVKKPEPSKDETASAKPQSPTTQAQPQANGAKKDDGPNWLTDPRFKKDQSGDDVPFEAKDGKNKPPGNVTAPKGGWDNPNVVAQPGTPNPANPGMPPNNPVPAPGMGVLQPQQVPQPQPANPTSSAPKFSPVSEQDMKEVWIFIENASLASGKMPPPALIYQALVEAKSPAAELVRNGSIILTGSTKRESVWAFEAKAVLQGGYIASQNSVETVTAQQLKAALGIR